jgi:hypothetical protein
MTGTDPAKETTMPIIQAVCRDCGARVDLEPDGVLMFTTNGSARDGTYLYYCDACERVAARPVNSRDLSLLAIAGVRDHGSAAGAAGSAGIRPFAPDDVSEFRRLLASADWFAKLRNGTYGACA